MLLHGHTAITPVILEELVEGPQWRARVGFGRGWRDHAVAAASFSAGWWRGLRAHGVTHALLVPSMIEMLLSEGALGAVPLRTLIYGASPIRPKTLARLLGLLPGVRMVNLFGQTEGSPITCLTPDDHALVARCQPSCC